MSLTLGEKLRQAREERGFTLSEVSEQTRISSSYLESIENDDYRILPGGIFNKGFVKSYAKFVGLNEQEALLDYSHLLSEAEGSEQETFKVYRPEVLTDDRSAASMAPTIILAVLILALMTTGVLFLVNYLRRPADQVAANSTPKTSANVATDTPVTADIESTPSKVPDMATLKVEFKALSQPVSLSATNDGRLSSSVITPGSSALFEPKESLKLSYARALATLVQLTINGKSILLPAVPFNPKRNAIEFEINKDNILQIWTSGAISTEVPAASVDANTNANVEPANTQATPIAVRPTPVIAPRAPANSAPRPTPQNPVNAVTPNPSPARKVIVIGNVNRPE